MAAAAAAVLRGYVIPGCSYEERAGGRSLRHLIIIITKLQELLQHTITITSPPVGSSTPHKIKNKTKQSRKQSFVCI
jgi:hypothetical protein